ncbi:MAG: gliding motility-associated C-terminal domain-containing protein [Chitinophagaceae bacterium]|nr:gliding motility-associated C-terminal domain-containing protein [Chitinophagaceae bacterium]
MNIYKQLKYLPLLFTLFFNVAKSQVITQSNFLENDAAQTVTCTNWLRTDNYPSGVTVGDVDVAGNQLTVEALFYRSTAFDPTLNFGKLVSKHTSAANVNYSLMPVTCEITTTNGYINTPPICTPFLDRIYHVAMVYDGAILKFYRNGFLMSSVPWTGNLINNNLLTTISNGSTFPSSSFQHFGYVNEVRIWNIARSQTEIRAFMNTSLPSPSTIPGLLAYYTFDDLINKQGNPAWNGTISGTAVINTPVPDCNYNADTCAVYSNLSGTINTYTPVLSLSVCDNKITVEDATTFNVGDTVMIIQMKGAVIDSTNTAAFGTITDYKNAGNYEINYVKTKSGNIIELKNKLTRQYDLPNGKVQLIRVPYYQQANITTELTCPAWDGKTGGVLVLNVQNDVVLNANINVSGKGFRGGNDPVTNPSSFFCNEAAYFYDVNPSLASEKGEGVAAISAAKSYGRGALANGGGGGNSHNSGGGGGSNAGTGGFGGYNFEGNPCATPPFDNRGVGGKQLTYSNAQNKVFMGGGGGAGQSNNFEAFEAWGGEGGGIVILMAEKIKSNGFRIIANGDNGRPCVGSGSGCHEGMGGGGGGGAVLLKTATYLDNISIETKGGNGADMNASGFLRLGPGGGGGSGVLWLSAAATPGNVTHINTGGINGVCTAYSNDAWGATPGAAGILLNSLVIPIDNLPFKPNIDSVRFRDSAVNCSDFDFRGFAYTNTNPVANWFWDFGDGGTATTQNASHSFSPGNYSVKLVVTDINGCKDSISRNISVSVLNIDAGPSSVVCSGNSVTLQATTVGGILYSWMPAAYVDNPSILSPVASPPVTTMFYLTATNAFGCEQKDSVLVTVRSASTFAISTPTQICKLSSAQLFASGGDIYVWTPAISLDNPAVHNPVASPAATTIYTVSITDTICHNTVDLQTTVTLLPSPSINASRSNDITCSIPQSNLLATGGITYIWTPSSTLNNPLAASPVATPTISTMYYVTGTGLNGCTNTDSVLVKVDPNQKGSFDIPTGFTPNGDGLNDCFGIKYWGNISEIEFSIFNRWGQLIFFTNRPGSCWNGKFKGIEQPPGVFVYMIRAKSSCDPAIFKKGTFVLIR